jgi:hypothetical protein
MTASLTTLIGAMYLALGDVLVDEQGATMPVASFELYGGEVAVFGPSVDGLRGDRYLFGRDEQVRVIARPLLNREG